MRGDVAGPSCAEACFPSLAPARFLKRSVAADACASRGFHLHHCVLYISFLVWYGPRRTLALWFCAIAASEVALTVALVVFRCPAGLAGVTLPGQSLQHGVQVVLFPVRVPDDARPGVCCARRWRRGCSGHCCHAGSGYVCVCDGDIAMDIVVIDVDYGLGRVAAAVQRCSCS